MRPITHFILLMLCATSMQAQYLVGGQIGATLPLVSRAFPNDPGFSGVYNLRVRPTFTLGGYLVSNKDNIVNLGGGVFLKRYSIYSHLERKDFNGTSIISINHRSTFMCFHPIVDVNLDRSRFLHLLFAPSASFLVSGYEDGYYDRSRATTSNYNHTSQNIKKFILGIGVYLQARYPINNKWKATASLGYSINAGVAKHIPSESGSVTFQLGLAYNALFKRVKAGPAIKVSQQK